MISALDYSNKRQMDLCRSLFYGFMADYLDSRDENITGWFETTVAASIALTKEGGWPDEMIIHAAARARDQLKDESPISNKAHAKTLRKVAKQLKDKWW